MSIIAVSVAGYGSSLASRCCKPDPTHWVKPYIKKFKSKVLLVVPVVRLPVKILWLILFPDRMVACVVKLATFKKRVTQRDSVRLDGNATGQQWIIIMQLKI